MFNHVCISAQTARVPGERRPEINNLYDVFMNIRDDEAEHCVTMRVCQTNGALQSPHDVQQGCAGTRGRGVHGLCGGGTPREAGHSRRGIRADVCALQGGAIWGGRAVRRDD